MVTKVGFTGSHGTGKTTALLEAAAIAKKHGRKVVTVEETARTCPGPINKEATYRSQTHIFANQLQREIEAEWRTDDLVLTDRTVLDIAAYNQVNLDDVSNNFLDNKKSFIKEWMETYDVVVYFPPRDDYLVDDGVREVDIDYRDKIDNVIKDLLKEMRPRSAPEVPDPVENVLKNRGTETF